jgi:hypothetical protein
MASLNLPLPAGIPDPLFQAAAHEAALDADRVALFLEGIGFRPAHGDGEVVPVRLPGGLLLGLGAALRLLLWESGGARAHLPVDLPSSEEVIRDLFVAAFDRDQPERLDALAHELTRRVLRVWVDHFAWDGRQAWDADLVLGEADEDALVEALAEFLWQHRNAPNARQGENA